MTPPASPAPRLHALDQFRGYTMLGMFLVNFVGSLTAVVTLWPTLKHHHTYVSYADTIMPQFLFAAGVAYRLTFVRRRARDGDRAAYLHALRRGLALVLLGLIVHQLGREGIAKVPWDQLTWEKVWDALSRGLKRDVFQALTHIGVTTLWVLPVIGLGALPRVLYMVLSGGAFAFLSWQFYYVWVNTDPVGIDGGPLGFLTWCIPMLAGSLACDAFLSRDGTGGFRDDPAWGKVVFWGAVLMLVGYALSCLNRVTPPNGTVEEWQEKLTAPGGLEEHWRELLVEPPFVPPADPATKNMWTMSQRSGAVTYPTFCAGFSLVVFVVFWLLCDRLGVTVAVFDTFGQNALVGYILHDMLMDLLKPYIPRDAPLWYDLAAVALFVFLLWLCLRHLQKQKLFLRL